MKFREKVTLITVGKIKERFFEDAIAEYSKRLSRYCKLEIIQVADEKTPDGASENCGAADQRKRKDRGYWPQIREGAYVIALAIEGKMLSSEELAGKMQKLGVEGKWTSGICHRRIIRTFKGGYGPGGSCLLSFPK